MDARLIHAFFAGVRPRQVRTLRQFAEQEVILPVGDERWRGRPWSAEFIPLTGLVLDEIGSGRWRRFFAVASGQSAKTFTMFCIPVLYHLFELAEPVGIGVPVIDAASAIWQERLRPVIEKTRYRELLPRRGIGSKGGRTTVLYFRNGAHLRFMGSGGKDIQRASHSLRVVLATEIEEMQTAGAASVEASPLASFEARSRGFGEAARFYGESIPGPESGIAWQEAMVQGSGAEIFVRCPHCAAFVLPAREQLKGVDEALSELEAERHGRLACPKCGVLWDEGDRLAAIAEPRLVHRGQQVDARGRVTGPLPQTHTFGVHWTALHTPLTTLGKVAGEEWRARQSEKETDLQALMQYTWARPYTPGAESAGALALSANAIRERVCGVDRGTLPAGVEKLVVGIDVGKYFCYWTCVAWLAGAAGVVVDYGVIEVPQGAQAAEQALLAALRQFRDEVLARGWPESSPPSHQDTKPDQIISGSEPEQKNLVPLCLGGEKFRIPDLVLIDQGDQQSTVEIFAGETRLPRLIGTKGFGTKRGQTYWHPPKPSATRAPGPGGEWYVARDPGHPQWIGFHDDYWKRWLHQRLLAPALAPGSLVLCAADSKMAHHSYAKHLVAELEREEFTPAGRVVKWVQQNPNNHWLDATKLCGLAAEMLGLRVMPARPGERPPPRFVTGPREVRRGTWAERVNRAREQRGGR